MRPTSLPNENPVRLADEHAQLRDLLKQMQTCFAEASASPDEATALLDNAREQLETHFQHEETGGYFRGILEASPHLRNRVAELEHEHVQFLALLDHMRARAASHDVEEVWRSDCASLFEEFRASLLAHESSEHELMQEAYSQDIGDKD
jgi:hemerythrin